MKQKYLKSTLVVLICVMSMTITFAANWVWGLTNGSTTASGLPLVSSYAPFYPTAMP